MGPRLHFDEIENKWVYEYGIFPMYKEYFDSKEEALEHSSEIFEKHERACDAFKFVADYLCRLAGRRMI